MSQLTTQTIPTMKITAANRKTWEDLYQAATAFRDLAPWKWMYDSDMFGVEDPVSGEIGWCCIMGAAGEVFALGCYPGDEGYRSYAKLVANAGENLSETDQLALGLDQKILKVEFVDRDEMDKTDRAVFKSLGLKFRGHNQWVEARDISPGYLPHFMTDAQAAFMAHCLQQATEVAKRFREDEEILNDKKERTLVRVPTETKDGLTWEDRFLPEPEWGEEPLREVNSFLVNRAKKELKREKAAICFSLDYMPSPILSGPGETRPFFSKIAMWIAYGSAYILGFKLFTPKEFDKEFEPSFFEQLHQLEIIPQQLIVNSGMAYDAVEPITQALGIELIFEPDLDEFNEVREGMMGRFMV